MADEQQEQHPLTAGGEIRKGSGVINDAPVTGILVPSKSEMQEKDNNQGTKRK